MEMHMENPNWADEIAEEMYLIRPNVATALRKAALQSRIMALRDAAAYCGDNDFFPDHDRWRLQHRFDDLADKLEATSQ